MEKQIPFFSVLIPVYNTGAFLEKCIASIGREHSFSVEILVTDDCSMDDSAEILAKIAAADPRIQVLHHPVNRGLYEARRTGVSNCHGQYVLFLDSDDQLAEGALNRLYEFLQKNPVDVLQFSYRTEPFGTVTPPQPYEPDRMQISALLRAENKAMPTLWNKVYDGEMLRRAYKRLCPGYVNMSEDAVQSIAIAFEAKNSAVLPGGPIYEYRYDTGISTSDGLTLAGFEKILKSRKTALALIRNFLTEYDLSLLHKVDDMEMDFLAQTIHEQINVQMADDLRDEALLLLPQYFNNRLIVPHLHAMRTKFQRMTTENAWFAFAKKADNITNFLFPEGSLRRKIAAAIVAILLFIPKILFLAVLRVYRIFRPHPDDVRRRQLTGKK